MWKTISVDSDWEYEVGLSPEEVVDQGTGAKIRVATVSVRKVGDETERFSLKTAVSYLPQNSNLGDYINIPENGIAPADGFIVAAGSSKYADLNIFVDGVLRGYVIRRGYGTGPITATVPIRKGSSYTVTGSIKFRYFVPLNKS